MVRYSSRRFLHAFLVLWLASTACNLASSPSTSESQGITMTVAAIVAETLSAIPPTDTIIPLPPTSTPKGTNTAEPTSTITSTSHSETVSYLTDRMGGYSEKDLKKGKVGFEYPSEMAPETSDIFFLSIFVPVEYYKASLSYTITTPLDAPKPIGNEYTTWEGDITVAPQMKVELSSLDFIVDPEFELAKKKIDIAGGNKTTWSWLIKSSSIEGIQTLLLKIYLGDALEPIWEHRLQVNIQNPTSTPSLTATITPSATSTPTLTATLTNLDKIYKDPGALQITLAIIGIIGTILVALIPIMAQKKKAE